MAVAVGKRLPAAPEEQQDMLRLRELLGDHLQSNWAPVGAASTEDELFKAELLFVRLVCLEIQRYFYEYVYAMLVLVSNINSLSFSAHNSSTEILNGIISAGSVEALTCKAKQSPTDTILAVDADIFPAKKSGNGSRFECGTVGGAQYDDDDDEDGGDDDEEAGDEGGDVEEEGVEEVHGGGDEDEEDEDAAEGAADDDDDDDDPDEPYEEEDEDEDDEDDEEDNDEEEEPPKKRKK